MNKIVKNPCTVAKCKQPKTGRRAYCMPHCKKIWYLTKKESDLKSISNTTCAIYGCNNIVVGGNTFKKGVCISCKRNKKTNMTFTCTVCKNRTYDLPYHDKIILTCSKKCEKTRKNILRKKIRELLYPLKNCKGCNRKFKIITKTFIGHSYYCTESCYKKTAKLKRDISSYYKKHQSNISIYIGDKYN